MCRLNFSTLCPDINYDNETVKLIVYGHLFIVFHRPFAFTTEKKIKTEDICV